MLWISHGTPNDIRMANEFAPSEFDTPTPPSFFRIINTLEIPSGKQPPAAKNVIPITASFILNVSPENGYNFNLDKKRKKNRTEKRIEINAHHTNNSNHPTDQIRIDTNPTNAHKKCNWIQATICFWIRNGER